MVQIQLVKYLLVQIEMYQKPLYHQVAGQIENMIDLGTYQTGERLPGVRRLSKDFGVSVGTVLEALYRLQNSGKLEARPRSGYYVAAQMADLPATINAKTIQTAPKSVSNQAMVLTLASASNDPKIVQLGAALPHPDYQPRNALARHFRTALREHPYATSTYEFPPGYAPLRKIIATRMHRAGIQLHPDQITITNGCQEAVTICLSVVAKPGDIIAVESPAYYGLLQCIESLGMRALELETDPVSGVDPGLLDSALKRWPVKACVLTANGNNPLGYITSDENKRDILRVLKNHTVALIEDDIYGDLSLFGHGGGERPKAMSAFATKQLTFYCSSFSKTVSPAIRVGWIASNALNEQVRHAKFLRNIATASIDQIALANYLANSAYDRHLDKHRDQYTINARKMLSAITEYFPAETRATHPRAGFTIWVQMPQGIDGNVLTYACLKAYIGIFPGQLFSASGRYKNYIRLSCAQPVTDKIVRAMKTVGSLALATH